MKGLRALLAALLLLAQAGCALHPRVETLGPGGYAGLNERAARQSAKVSLSDGTQVRARGLSVVGGTASWTDPETGRPVSAPVTRIAEVRLRNESGRGAAIGATRGFLIGAAVGGVIGLAEGAGGDEPWSSPEGDALFAAVATGLVGWLAGLPIGAVVGVDDIYRFPPPPLEAPNPILERESPKP